jgi:4-hydroxy-3-polyprenylbenzoate decarboxylase
MIAAVQDDPDLDIHDMKGFFGHVLSRLDLRRDLHFQTKTTMDTLDYSGTGLNEGSKVVLAAAGPPIRRLGTESPIDAKVVLPGVLVLEGQVDQVIQRLEAHAAFRGQDTPWPLVVVVDDVDQVRSLEDFLWITFTRSNPSHDVFGVHATVEHKHWGCDGALVIDATVKPHHAPPLVEDPKVTARVDQLFAKGGALHGIV